MTVTDVNFRITGPCLSLLFRDCECSGSDQIGFLIGENYSITTQTVSDAEMEEEKIVTSKNINGTFTVGHSLLLCNPLGRIDEDSLQEILGSSEKDIIGWYSFRRNSNQRPTMRETILHRELCKSFTHIPSKYFLFCIITTSDTDGNATYSHKLTFFINNRRFSPVSVFETNLGEPDDNSYRRSTLGDTSFKHLQQVFHSLNGVSSSKGAMNTLHTEINKHIEGLERNVSNLQAEADSLLHKMSSSNCSLNDEKNSRRDGSVPSTSTKMKPEELSVEY